MWDKEGAIAHLNARAHEKSQGRCAQYVRQAVEAGGVRLARHASAKDYGSSLLTAGFRAVAASNHPMAGDVAVIQPIEGHPHGHMAMYNGQAWVSDFRQRNGYYPGQSYRAAKPPVTFYRVD
jgi:hypothetical protein